MDFSIAAILVQDGWTNGAVYALIALALVLVFSVTRVIFIPQGEYLAFAALTLAGLQAGQFPRIVWMLIALGAAVFIVDLAAALLHRHRHDVVLHWRSVVVSGLKNLAYPQALLLAIEAMPSDGIGTPLAIVLTFLLVAPMGAMLYRLVFQPAAEASVLVLLIISVGLHFVLLGCGLLIFGPEGARALPLTNASWDWAGVMVTGQSLAVILAALLLIGVLYAYFEYTLAGTALRATAVNRVGARLVGIGTARAGRMAFSVSAVLGVVAGILVSPITTMQYDTGFVIALKGFVAAIVGALASYPMAAAGAVLVGLLESFGSFWASAYKEVIVFTLIIPVLVWRSLTARHVEES